MAFDRFCNSCQSQSSTVAIPQKRNFADQLSLQASHHLADFTDTVLLIERFTERGLSPPTTQTKTSADITSATSAAHHDMALHFSLNLFSSNVSWWLYVCCLRLGNIQASSNDRIFSTSYELEQTQNIREVKVKIKNKNKKKLK